MQRQLPSFIEETRLRRAVGQLLASGGKRNINEGSPDGIASYALLSPKTVAKKGFSLPLIGAKQKGVMSGVLRNSISYELGKGDTIYLTAMDYAKYHQFENRGKSTAPHRPIFTIRNSDVPDIMRFVTDAFTRRMNKLSK